MRRISILDLCRNCVISCVCLHSPLAFQTDIRRGLAIGVFGDEHRDQVYECSSDPLCSSSFFGVLICHLGDASLLFGM